MKISIKEFNMEATVEDIQKITEKKSNDADIWGGVNSIDVHVEFIV